ncbi:MAG: GMP synthase [Gammaproteobacteria bacterium]|nr:GMP synthase [Gammaproteobacteria bacterium]MDH5803200.1 GMP synthase [Gammaproteobacteria bacterium]
MTKIGILQFDSVLPQYQDRFGDYPDMIVRLLQQSDPSLQFHTYDVVQGRYPQPQECSAYITTGSKDSVYDPLPWMEKFSGFIHRLHEQQVKLVAICFGHQLVAELFGGKTQEANQGWGVGVAQNRVVQTCTWMQPSQDSFNLVVSHKDQVVQLPKGAQLLARSDFCPHFMYLMDTFLCLQGHPEFSKEYGRTMMQHRQDKLGPSVYAQGIESLNREAHDQLLSQWISNFLRN